MCCLNNIVNVVNVNEQQILKWLINVMQVSPQQKYIDNYFLSIKKKKSLLTTQWWSHYERTYGIGEIVAAILGKYSLLRK